MGLVFLYDGYITTIAEKGVEDLQDLMQNRFRDLLSEVGDAEDNYRQIDQICTELSNLAHQLKHRIVSKKVSN